jgi:glyoxylase-like metal-dependent hydrolase (beta-lactamase superfamily II)
LILECGFDAIYYLEGDDRGLLIDTGVGVGGLKEFVSRLAAKPYDVVLTHAHLDHIGAIWQYDNVYLNPLDLPLIKSVTDRDREDFLSHMAEMSEGRTSNQDPSQICRSGKDPDFIDIDTGFVFHLGGRDVEVQHTPGHSEGSVCLHDKKTGLLFVGDTIIYRLLLTNRSLTIAQRVAQWTESTRWIYENLENYPALYMEHCGRIRKQTIMELKEISDILTADPTDLDYSEGVPKKSSGSTQIYFAVPFADPYTK